MNKNVFGLTFAALIGLTLLPSCRSTAAKNPYPQFQLVVRRLSDPAPAPVAVAPAVAEPVIAVAPPPVSAPAPAPAPAHAPKVVSVTAPVAATTAVAAPVKAAKPSVSQKAPEPPVIQPKPAAPKATVAQKAPEPVKVATPSPTVQPTQVVAPVSPQVQYSTVTTTSAAASTDVPIMPSRGRGGRGKSAY